MLNIISRSLVSRNVRGPRKVVDNLIQGLDEIGQPYIINQALDAAPALWIHDDPAALLAAAKLPAAIKVVAGPNIFVTPDELPATLPMENILWLFPAQWVKDFWELDHEPAPQSAVWPAGIDTAVFTPMTDVEKDTILIYQKSRSDAEVKVISTLLTGLNEKFLIITYGKYSENEYRNALARAKAIIWVGRSESQGIGLLEALSMNVPAFVWDVSEFGHFTDSSAQVFTTKQLGFTGATAAPYFDSRCGTICLESEALPSQLNRFLHNITSYRPRDYVEENLSLDKQASAFCQLYTGQLTLSTTALESAERLSRGNWRNATWHYKVATQIKDAVRSLLR